MAGLNEHKNVIETSPQWLSHVLSMNSPDVSVYGCMSHSFYLHVYMCPCPRLWPSVPEPVQISQSDHSPYFPCHSLICTCHCPLWVTALGRTCPFLQNGSLESVG